MVDSRATVYTPDVLEAAAEESFMFSLEEAERLMPRENSQRPNETYRPHARSRWLVIQLWLIRIMHPFSRHWAFSCFD